MKIYKVSGAGDNIKREFVMTGEITPMQIAMMKIWDKIKSSREIPGFIFYTDSIEDGMKRYRELLIAPEDDK